MMQTDSASTDEDIGGRKEKDAPERGGTGRGSLLLALSRPPHPMAPIRPPMRNAPSCGRGCSAHDDGRAPSIVLADGMSGPPGSHCTTATHAARSAIRSGCKSFHSSKEAAAPRSVPDPIIRGRAARRVVTSSRMQQRFARKRSPRTGANTLAVSMHFVHG